MAETSLKYELGEQAAVYPAGGVPEYWVVDAVAEIVHVLRSPVPLAYGEHRVAGRGESIARLLRPEAALAVESLFATRH
ncbi:MAG: Uma2 family endonuclease [Planctomycetota bacterium]